MMLKTTMLRARTSVLPAIAAAMALSSTPLLAQQVPTTSTPTDPVAQTPPVTTPPVTDTAPASPDTSATETTTTTEAAPVKTTTAKTKTVARTTRTAAARPAPAPSRPAPTTTRTTVTQPATAPATPAAPPPEPAPAPNSDSAVAPVVDLSAAPANKPAQASKPSNATNEMLEIGGGALALIALGGIAYSVARRRRREDDWHGEWTDEPEMVEEDHVAAAPVMAEPRHDPIVHEEQPAIVGPSAFTWGQRPEATPAAERDSDDDRLPGESWVERAHRGPSANNPSVSLKNRLRRAAFFDKRERDVAAGIAEPVDPDAGLPEAMVEQDERELA